MDVSRRHFIVGLSSISTFGIILPSPTYLHARASVSSTSHFQKLFYQHLLKENTKHFNNLGIDIISGEGVRSLKSIWKELSNSATQSTNLLPKFQSSYHAEFPQNQVGPVRFVVLRKDKKIVGLMVGRSFLVNRLKPFMDNLGFWKIPWTNHPAYRGHLATNCALANTGGIFFYTGMKWLAPEHNDIKNFKKLSQTLFREALTKDTIDFFLTLADHRVHSNPASLIEQLYFSGYTHINPKCYKTFSPKENVVDTLLWTSKTELISRLSVI